MKIAAAIAMTVAIGVSAAAQRQVYSPGDGVTLPRLVKEVKPTYTPTARERQVQGNVLLEAVVEDTGRVEEIAVLESLDEDLDRQAIAALKQWEFVPGTRDGEPVPVRIACELTFTLK